MTVLARWSIDVCPDCGTYNPSGRCMDGPCARAPECVKIEAVPVEQLQGAVDALVKIAGGLRGADCQAIASKALEAMGVKPPTSSAS
jgi:hypothetical protein